jgi:nitrate reductase NapE component
MAGTATTRLTAMTSHAALSVFWQRELNTLACTLSFTLVSCLSNTIFVAFGVNGWMIQLVRISLTLLLVLSTLTVGCPTSFPGLLCISSTGDSSISASLSSKAANKAITFTSVVVSVVFWTLLFLSPDGFQPKRTQSSTGL